MTLQDCEEAPPLHDRPKEPSAFSAYNIASGPFFDPQVVEQPSKREKKRSAWLRDAEEWAEEHEFTLPLPEDLGKQSRTKEKERLAKKAQDMQGDEEEDWFNRPGPSKATNGKSGGGGGGGGRGPYQGGGNGKGPPTGPKKMQFGNFNKNDTRYTSSRGNNKSYGNDLLLPSRPIQQPDSLQIRGASSRHYDDRSRDRDRDRGDHNRDRGDRSNQYRDDDKRPRKDWRHDKYDDDYRDPGHGDRYRDRGDSKNTPRYKGGYGR